MERILDMRPSMDGSGDEVFCKLQGKPRVQQANWAGHLQECGRQASAAASGLSRSFTTF